MEEIVGIIERLTFQSPDSGFTVAQVQQKGHKETTCTVGAMPTVRPGETVRLKGTWKQHPSWGRQFEVASYEVIAPSDIVGIRKYLGSGLIKGIGPKYAERIVKAFGKETLDIIDQAPERLLEVEGIGKKRVEVIKECWQEQRSIREVMLFLQAHDISPAFAQKIYKHFGQNSIALLKENPYRLADEIHGIGFKSADKVAIKLGMAQNAPERIRAGITFALGTLSDTGHVCYPEELFLPEAELMLEVEKLAIENELEGLEKEGKIVRGQKSYMGKLLPFLWSKPHFVSESGIAEEIFRIGRNHSLLRDVDARKALDWVEEKLSIKLAEEQKRAVAEALRSKLLIITGGPGTGKSTITNAILRILEKLTSKILLAAPTGRAAKRMSEITGKDAKTIHSLLEFGFGSGFKRNRQNPLECDLIICDEASMIDTFLMYALLKAIPSNARVIFVGDTNQLPSVGPGNVLRDLIASKALAVVELTEIFRQAQGSNIVTNAHKINQGIYPELKRGENSDFFFIEENDPEKLTHTILQLVTRRIPMKYGFDPLREIQVLSPMRRGLAGTENLNLELQKSMNPGKEGVLRYGRNFSVGDKVMQIQNNYNREVFNGDVGIVTHIDFVEQELVVQIDERDIVYDFSDLDELVLAYAVTIHKYQGSEMPCIVMPVHTTHFMLLTRNLLYTGVTRAKKLLVIVGSLKALAIAIRNNEVEMRFTGLQEAISDRRLQKVL